MKKIILSSIFISIIFASFGIYKLGYKIPKKDIHKDWPYFPVSTHSNIAVTSYDSMFITSGFKITGQPYMLIYYFTEKIDPLNVSNHSNSLNNKDKIGIFDINMKAVFFRDFSETPTGKNIYFFTIKDKLYDLIIDEKDSLKSELYYAPISSKISFQKIPFTFIKNTDEELLSSQGENLLIHYPLRKNNTEKDYYLLLINKKTQQVYIYKQRKNQDLLTAKFSNIQWDPKRIEYKDPEINCIDSVMYKNELTTKPLSFTPTIKNYYIFYYNLKIDGKTTYFKFQAMDSEYIKREYMPILISQKKYFYIKKGLYYPGNSKLFEIYVK